MESDQQAANLANIKTARLTKVLVVLAVAQILASFIVVWLSQPSSPAPSPVGSILARGWLPIVFLLSSSFVTSTALVVVAFRRWKNKPLRQRNSILEADVSRLNHQLAKANNELKLFKENHERIELDSERLSNQLKTLRLDTAREIKDVSTRLNGTEEALKATQGELDEANKRAKDQENQKNNFDQLYHDEKAKYEKLLWVTEIIERQQKAINDHVSIDKLTKVRICLCDSDDTGPPRIRFGFQIRNDSLFEITIHTADVTGHVSFRGRNLRESVKHDLSIWGFPSVSRLAHKGFGWLFLEQEFTNSEIDRIKKSLKIADAQFGFEDIFIEVSGGTRFPDVTRQMVPIPESFRSVLLSECEIKSDTIASEETA